MTFWNSVVFGKPLLNGRVSRKANRICTPVCATRSSCSRSAKLRSQRCRSDSPRRRGSSRVIAARPPATVLEDSRAFRLTSPGPPPFGAVTSGNAGFMQIMSRLEEARSLDPVSDKLQSVVYRLARSQSVRDLLHGTWLGHALHPVLVQLPVGSFISAAVLDLLPGTRRSATVLIAVGTAGIA